MIDEDANTCKVCGRDVLEFVGPVDSKILIVCNEPEDEDFSKGMIYTGKRGLVLAGELDLAGIPIQRARLVCMNMHKQADDCMGSFHDVLREMKDKKGVLLIGSETISRFVSDKKPSDLIGLCISSPYFPHSVGFVMCTSNPPTSDLLGEFRLSIQKFARKLKEVKND